MHSDEPEGDGDSPGRGCTDPPPQETRRPGTERRTGARGAPGAPGPPGPRLYTPPSPGGPPAS